MGNRPSCPVCPSRIACPTFPTCPTCPAACPAPTQMPTTEIFNGSWILSSGARVFVDPQSTFTHNDKRYRIVRTTYRERFDPVVLIVHMTNNDQTWTPVMVMPYFNGEITCPTGYRKGWMNEVVFTSVSPSDAALAVHNPIRGVWTRYVVPEGVPSAQA